MVNPIKRSSLLRLIIHDEREERPEEEGKLLEREQEEFNREESAPDPASD